MQYCEQGVAVLLYFWPLMSGLSVLNRERVQAECLLHGAEFCRGGIVHCDPYEAIRTLQIVGDLANVDVAEFPSVLVRGAVDEHRLIVRCGSGGGQFCRCE